MDSIHLDAAAGLIAENLSNPGFGVAQLALALKVSETNLRDSFARHFGERPHSFMRRVRMQRAFQLLRSGQTVEVVWRSVGYGSARAFRYAFKRVYGTTPGTVKSQVENNVVDVRPSQESCDSLRCGNCGE